MVELKPADILAFRATPESPIWDRAIGWGEHILHRVGSDKRNYYHIAFVSSDTSKMYSAQPPKINLYDIPNPLPSYIEVYRFINPLTTEEKVKLFKYAESKRGTWYNFLGVLTGGFIQIGNVEFCSQYTWISFTYGNRTLCPFEFLESPDDIVNSTLIERVV